LDRVLILSPEEEYADLNTILTKVGNEDEEMPYLMDLPRYTCTHASEGEQALEMVRRSCLEEDPFCLAVMDLSLIRRQRGFHYARHIRKIDGRIQIIVLIEEHDEYWQERADYFGKRDYILFLHKGQKPIELLQCAMVLYRKYQLEKNVINQSAGNMEDYNRLVKEKVRADQDNTVKTEFLTRMSHEIRTPLNILLGIHEILGDSETDEYKKKYLEIANRSGDRLLNLLNNTLSLSKVLAGKDDLDKVVFETSPFFENILEAFTVKAKKFNVALSAEISPKIPPLLIGDIEKLTIIYNNLIDNAIKFSSGGSVKVKVMKEANEGRGKKNKFYIRSIIEDTGCGIPESQQDKIFGEFTQVDGPNKDLGSGLGLNICVNYINLMKGRLRVSSRPNEGTTFSFALPLEVAEAPEPSSSVEPNRPIDDAEINAKILLIEDNEDNAELIRIYLKPYSCHIDVAENGKLGVELYQKKEYDLILMDIEMPVMDGFEASREIRTFEKEKGKTKTPIIALTGRTQSSDIDQCLKVGCNEVFSKPVRRKKIVECIKKYSGKK